MGLPVGVLGCFLGFCTYFISVNFGLFRTRVFILVIFGKYADKTFPISIALQRP